MPNAGFLSGETGKRLDALIRSNYVDAGNDRIVVTSRDTDGTFLRLKLPEDVEGDFEGDALMTSEDLFDVVVDNPFGFTVLWAELTGDGGTCSILYPIVPSFSGEPIHFAGDSGDPYHDILTTGDRYSCSQHVPATGYLQLNTNTATGLIHYKIHYRKDP